MAPLGKGISSDAANIDTSCLIPTNYGELPLKIFLVILAAIFLVFGAIYLLEPMRLASDAGLFANASGQTDIRATYGGFQIGFGFFLAWCAVDDARMRLGLVAVALVVGAVGLSRVFGIIVDGDFSGFNQIGLVFEFIVTLSSLWLLLIQPSKR